MAFFRFNNITISGIATAVPTNIVDIDNFKPRFGDERVEKFKKKAGVYSLHKTAPEQTASDLGCAAVRELLKNKKIDSKDIDAFVFLTQSPDYRRPATSHVMHKRLGFRQDCSVFDISLGCSGFIYGLQVLSSMMVCSDIQKAILVVAETSSKVVSPTDGSSVMLLGDAGCAILLEKTDSSSEIQGCLMSKGEQYRTIMIPAGGYRNMDAPKEAFTWPDGNDKTLYDFNMSSPDVMSFSIGEVPETINEFLSRTNTDEKDYDCIALHQASKYVINQITKRVGFPKEKMPTVLDKYGNTASASIPLLLCNEYGEIAGKAVNVLASGFGVGLSWGVASFKVDTDVVYPVIETDESFPEGIINSPDDMNK